MVFQLQIISTLHVYGVSTTLWDKDHSDPEPERQGHIAVLTETTLREGSNALNVVGGLMKC